MKPITKKSVMSEASAMAFTPEPELGLEVLAEDEVEGADMGEYSGVDSKQ
jgi:hypothetical protein